MTWGLRWHFTTDSLNPGSITSMNLNFENYENNYLALSEFEVRFDFGIYSLSSLFLANSSKGEPGLCSSELFRIPETVGGTRSYNFRYKIHRYIRG